ncbi:MAG: hypothetical protein KDD42_08750, partial [Bdellovibrionales bacterium]|nr:hypothetical protein [Bdellovibrionales bacterium]
VGILIVLAASWLPAVDNLAYMDLTALQSADVINFSSNAFYAWRAEPFVSLYQDWWRACQLFKLPLTGSFLSPTLTVLFAAGVYHLGQRLDPRSTLLESALVSLLLGCLLLYLFGANAALWGVIAVLPHVVALGLGSNTNSPGDKVYLLASAAMLLLIANQLSMLVVLIALLAWLCMRITSSRSLTLSSVVLMMTAVCALYFSGVPAVPAYPALSHVVPDDGLPGMIRPLIGPDAPIPLIDREFSKNILALPALLIFIASVLLRILNNARSSAGLISCAICLSGLVWLDAFPTEGLAQIAPLAALQRIVPHYFFFELGSIVLAASITLLGVAASSRTSKFPAFPSMLIVAFIVTSQARGNVNLPVLNHPQAAAVFQAGLHDAGKDADRRMHIIQSPSYAVVRSQGLWLLDDIQQLQSLGQISKRRKNLELKFSDNDSDAAFRKVFDHNLNTRWSSSTGMQSGNEWIAIRLLSPQSVRGLDLATGEYGSDFPRGLRVYGFETCEDLPTPATRQDYKSKILINVPHWPGRIDFSPAGFPYYDGQSNVRIWFKENVYVSCLLVQQIGRSETFEWSVAEIQVLK